MYTNVSIIVMNTGTVHRKTKETGLCRYRQVSKDSQNKSKTKPKKKNRIYLSVYLPLSAGLK